MDADFWRLMITLVEAVFIIGSGVYAWWNTRTRATQEQFKSTNGNINNLHNRVNLIEADVLRAPGHREIGEVHSRVDQIGQAVTGIQGEMKQMNNTLVLIQQHLLDKKS